MIWIQKSIAESILRFCLSSDEAFAQGSKAPSPMLVRTEHVSLRELAYEEQVQAFDIQIQDPMSANEAIGPRAWSRVVTRAPHAPAPPSPKGKMRGKMSTSQPETWSHCRWKATTWNVLPCKHSIMLLQT